MKRFLLIILCLCFVLSGCKKVAEEAIHNHPLPEMNVEGETAEHQSLKISKEWSVVETIGNNRPDLAVRDYEAKVDAYTIKKNLANVENIDRFTGFTNKQLTMLADNGFVVLPGRDTKIFYIYDENEYSGIPNFITTDSVLHTFHQFYDKSLMYIETSFLYDELELMTEQMLDKSIAVHKALKDEELIKLQEKNIVYFLVANMLMESSSPIITNVDKNLMEVAKEEIKLIEKAETFEKSHLFDFDLDYSQFKVRGHYTRSEELGKFFKTMMWYGIAPLPLTKDNGEFLYENTLQALLMSFTTFLQSGDSSAAEHWSRIYEPTGQYVGLSDDIHVFNMNALRLQVYGESNDPNRFNEKAYYNKLVEAVKALPEPRIQGEFTEVTTPTGKQFRFMGQRYILDSFIMQNLMKHILRPIPSGLDVMGVMGSHTAEKLLFEVYKPQERWPEYEENYKKLKAEVNGYSDEIWEENLYNGWLWSIQEALTEFDADSGMPMFMTTEAWKNKSLNTALGSYTELKHDTVLYGKQPAVEMGGPLEYGVKHYVEPNIPLYSKLLHLTEYTLSVLEGRGMKNDLLSSGANAFKALLELLIDCSIKELRNEALSNEENDQLLWYGGTIESISRDFLAGITEDYSLELSDMLVTDVATVAPADYPGGYLSLGTGYFDPIYVVVPVNGKLILSRGAVYSHYEFLSDTRLTDEEWWALNGLHKIQEDFGSYLEKKEPSEALPAQPFWVKAFKSDSNAVKVEPLEVDWNQLKE